MLIIDSHAHTFKGINGITKFGKTSSGNYGKINISNGDSLRLLPPLAVKTSFTNELFIEYMDWAGVHKAVLLQSPFYGNLNDYIYSTVKRWPDRFVGAAYLDPWQKNVQVKINPEDPRLKCSCGGIMRPDGQSCLVCDKCGGSTCGGI